MIKTQKPSAEVDASQATQLAFNDVNDTLSVDGFLVGLVGRKVTQTISTTTIANDTATHTFSENGVDLYTIQVVYTDGTRSDYITAERIA